MQPFSHLNRDVRPQEQPAGTYQFAKNGVMDYIRGSALNEPGFSLMQAVAPYEIIGVIETDKYPIILSTNNVNSAGGLFNTDTDEYIPVFNDATLPFKLNFSTSRYITGQSQRNYKRELIAVFTDKHLPPFYVNFDNPDLSSLNSMLLFPGAVPPDVSTQLQGGGNLLPGAYYIAVNYEMADGFETPFVSTSQPVIVSGPSGIATDRSVEILISGADQRYTKINIAVVSKVNGVFSAVKLTNSINLFTGTAAFTYTGTELTETITLEEVLAAAAVYDKVGCIGQLNDELYLGELEAEAALNMQRYANLIKIKWHSTLVATEPVDPDVASGRKKGFMHREVYAFYIRYKLTNGYTDLFHIPGNTPVFADYQVDADATAELLTAKKYQVKDTIPSFNFTAKTGDTGIWMNDETYPNTADFNSSALGGRDLRNAQVLHHRMPSVRWCKENLYQGEPEYGRTKLDLLGISVENVVIPGEYADRIIGWEIFFAKRTPSNSTVVGQSLLMYGAVEPETASVYQSTGGNFDSEVNFKSTPKRRLYTQPSFWRFHSFDQLFNKPAVTPEFMSFELKLRRTNIPFTDGYLLNGSYNGGANNGPLVYLLDYKRGVAPSVISRQFKGIKETQYIPNNAQAGQWKNIGIEGCFGGKMNVSEDLIPGGEISLQQVNPGSVADYTPASQAVQNETTFLCNLMNLPANVYAPFNAQPVARCASSNSVINTTVFFGGDVYVNDYTFHTYGLQSGGGVIHDGDENFCGTKIARRFVCESVSNLYARFEDITNQYTKFYPKSLLMGTESANYLAVFRREYEPNQFGYSKDSNALDELFSAVIYNFAEPPDTLFPYRIHRTGKLNRQNKRNWRTIRPLDYYEGQKNFGRIINIEGMDDALLIHYENALLITRDKGRLQTDIISVTLGSGDIFEFAPQEALSSKLGYAGAQQQLACVRTPFGYVFPDVKEQEVFIYKGGLKSISAEVSTFFKQYLTVRQNNSFEGNGITIGYDKLYKRLLLTVKNITAPNVVFFTDESGSTEYADWWIPLLSEGDVVYKDGRYQTFLGVNATAFTCDPAIVPVVNDQEITISEDTLPGTLIGTLTGTNIVTWLLLEDAPFLIRPDGKIYVSDFLDFFNTPDAPNRYVLTVRGVSSDGSTDTGTLTIILTQVDIPGTPLGSQPEILDNVTNGTEVALVNVVDREGPRATTFAITAGDDDGVFAIASSGPSNSVGRITVANASLLNAHNIEEYRLTVSARINALPVETTQYTEVVIRVNPSGPPVFDDINLTIFDDTAASSEIFNSNSIIDRAEWTVSVKDKSAVLDYNSGTGAVTTNAGIGLGGTETNNLFITFFVTDGLYTSELTVNFAVWHAYNSIKYQPAGSSCAATTQSWTNVEVVKLPATVIKTYANDVAAQTFQGIPVPYYPDLADSASCGGATVRNFSNPVSEVVYKQDCVSGLPVGITYTVPAGVFWSDVSLAAANAEAALFINETKFSFASQFGKCI